MPVIAKDRQDIFNGVNITDTDYIYNSAGGANATTGWFNADYDDVMLQVSCATLTSNWLAYRVEGRFADGERPAEIYSVSLAVKNDIDQLIHIDERVDELRVGVKTQSDSTPNRFYCEIFMRETRS